MFKVYITDYSKYIFDDDGYYKLQSEVKALLDSYNWRLNRTQKQQFVDKLSTIEGLRVINTGENITLKSDNFINFLENVLDSDNIKIEQRKCRERNKVVHYTFIHKYD